MKQSLTSAWRVCRRYQAAGPLTCAYAAARVAIVPVEPLRQALTGIHGDVLSIGAGIGVVESLLADQLPALNFVCSDRQADRVYTAQRTVQGPRLRFSVADATEKTDSHVYSAAMAVDVLHHIDSRKQADVLRHLVDVVRTEGLIIIKDIARTPAWKHAWNSVHDKVVSGEDTTCREPGEVVGMFECAGCVILESRRLHPYSPYPHYLVVAQKTA